MPLVGLSFVVLDNFSYAARKTLMVAAEMSVIEDRIFAEHPEYEFLLKSVLKEQMKNSLQDMSTFRISPAWQKQKQEMFKMRKPPKFQRLEGGQEVPIRSSRPWFMTLTMDDIFRKKIDAANFTTKRSDGGASWEISTTIDLGKGGFVKDPEYNVPYPIAVDIKLRNLTDDRFGVLAFTKRRAEYIAQSIQSILYDIIDDEMQRGAIKWARVKTSSGEYKKVQIFDEQGRPVRKPSIKELGFDSDQTMRVDRWSERFERRYREFENRLVKKPSRKRKR